MQIICIDKTFTPNRFGFQDFFAEIQQRLHQERGIQTILLFPESVFTETAITRSKAREIARQVQELAKQHGNSFVGYSVIEDIPSSGHQNYKILSNTGYFVAPTKKGNGLGYQAYPKITSYSNTFSLTRLTAYDNEIVMNANSGDSKASKAMDHWQRRAEKVKVFPSWIINGKKVGLCVCADASRQPDQLHHQAANEKFDLLLVPARGLGLDKNRITILRERLTENGTAIIMDSANGALLLGKRSRSPMQIKPREPIFFKSISKKAKTIRYQKPRTRIFMAMRKRHIVK